VLRAHAAGRAYAPRYGSAAAFAGYAPGHAPGYAPGYARGAARPFY
jgi:hypothetical protein